MNDDKQDNDKNHIVEYIPLTRTRIYNYSNNITIISYVKRMCDRISKKSAIILIKLLLEGHQNISYKAINSTQTFVRQNMGKFDGDNFKIETCLEIKKGILNIIKKIDNNLIEDNHKDELCTVFKVNEYTQFDNVRSKICEDENTIFKYDFKDKKLELLPPQNIPTLQLVDIQILSKPIKFHFPLAYNYNCPRCNNKISKLAYEVSCTKTKLICEGFYTFNNFDGQVKTKICGLSLIPDEDTSICKDAYYYDIGYNDTEGNIKTAGAFSFNEYEPGFYRCAIFSISRPNKTELFFIVDIEEIKSHKFILPEKVEDENYIFTLQKAIDKYIKHQTGLEIYGLNPIKAAMIVQKAINALKEELHGNIQLVGDASTGKSTVLIYYGYCLDSSYHLSTNGMSLSIPALRGTREKINLMGKEISIITSGFLGTFKSIHIDEAGENRELVQNLKVFLYENNYSYDKAGGTGTFRRRTAHGNLSENLDWLHIGQYRGSIKKEYNKLKELQEFSEYPDWDENEDLHQPIFTYKYNALLLKVIKEKRDEYRAKKLWWIDGYDYALHERFPFYFYLVNEKEGSELKNIIKENTHRNTITENLEIIRALRNTALDDFFNTLKDYKNSKYDVEGFNKVDEILSEYTLHCDSRQRKFYYRLLKLSRIINERFTIEEVDYDFIRYMIEKTNCKIEISDTADYKIHGAPEKFDTDVIIDKIKTTTDTLSNIDFGIPDDEFK